MSDYHDTDEQCPVCGDYHDEDEHYYVAGEDDDNDDNDDDDQTYKIVRYHFKGDNETIETGLTLEEAQAHCNDPSTTGDGWFDGYVAE